MSKSTVDLLMGFYLQRGKIVLGLLWTLTGRNVDSTSFALVEHG